MTGATRPLAGLVVSLSISESDDTLKFGYPNWQVNRVTLQFVAALFGQGASVIFGHDWREDGVMEAVYGFALQMQPFVTPSAQGAQAEAQPLMRNLIPWPDTPRLSQQEQEQLSTTLKVETAGLPEELQPFENEARTRGSNSPLHKYLRSRGLTFLRHKLNDLSHARICIGGRRSGSQGRYPGVIEEAFLAIHYNKPLYVSSLLGGASEDVVAAIEGKAMPDDFCALAPIEQLYRQPPVDEKDAGTGDDRTVDRGAIWLEFGQAGRERTALNKGLSVEENEELLRTPVVERAIELLLTGLSRIRQSE